MARKPTNLWRRGNVYYLRMRVPADVREAAGKEFVVQSLKTSDRREALRRLQIAQGEVQKQFDGARNQQRVPSRCGPPAETRGDRQTLDGRAGGDRSAVVRE